MTKNEHEVLANRQMVDEYYSMLVASYRLCITSIQVLRWWVAAAVITVVLMVSLSLLVGVTVNVVVDTIVILMTKIFVDIPSMLFYRG